MSADPPRVTLRPPRDAWRRVLGADPHALPFSTPEWVDAVCEGTGHENVTRLYQMPDGATLVLPLLRRAPAPGVPPTSASLPLGWGPGGLIGDRPLGADDVAAVWRDLAAHQGLATAVRPSPLLGEVWDRGAPAHVVRVSRVAHVLDLDGGFAQVWATRFSSATRTKLRRAERTGLTVERDTSGRLVPAFFALYERWLASRARDRRMPLPLALALGRRREPRRKLELAARALREDCRIWLARAGDQPVAAIIVLVGGRHAVYWRSASDRELARRTRANDLLQRMAIEDACDAGCRYYHMGESGGVESLMHFKARFGATPREYAEYRLERLPLTPLGARARAAAALLERRLMRGST